MMSFFTDAPESCGILELDELNIVIDYFEKIENPPSNIANGAVFILEPSVLEALSFIQKGEIDFCKEIIPKFKGKILAWPNDGYHRDIGTPVDLAKANAYWSEHKGVYNVYMIE